MGFFFGIIAMFIFIVCLLKILFLLVRIEKNRTSHLCIQLIMYFCTTYLSIPIPCKNGC